MVVGTVGLVCLGSAGLRSSPRRTAPWHHKFITIVRQCAAAIYVDCSFEGASEKGSSMNESAILKPSVLAAFRSHLRGTSLVRGDEGYDVARRVWNGAVDRHPSCIVRCATGY